jgi:spore coat protein U-like protein
VLLQSVVGVNFGAYNVFNSNPTDSAGSITYTCISLSGPITIDLSKGSALSYVPRQMRKGTDTLDYNLYLDAARVSIWGDGTGGASRYGPGGAAPWLAGHRHDPWLHSCPPECQGGLLHRYHHGHN